jgi:hypothetical protein
MDKSRLLFLLFCLILSLFASSACSDPLPFADGLEVETGEIPLWLKLTYTAFVAVLVPVYWVKWGPGNFLWFSDIALFGALVAVWLGSSLIASMMTLAVLLPELGWNLDYFSRLLTGKNVFGLSGYMFDSSRPLYLRALSLFHVILPALLIWLVYRLGYDPRALYYQTGLAWLVLPLTYLLTDPADNINWVRGPGEKPQQKIHPLLYLIGVMLFFPLFVYLPTHFLMRWLFA